MRFISWILSLFIMLLVLGFTVKNNGAMTLNFWPSSLEFTLPTSLWVFGFLFLGFVMGSLLTWLSMLKYRLEARRLRKEAASLQSQETLKTVPSPNFSPRKFKWFGK